MQVSLDGVGLAIPPAATLDELLEGIAPHIDPARLVTSVEVDGAAVDSTDRAVLARWRLGGSEAVSIRTEARGEFVRARREAIAGDVRRIADLLGAAAEGLVAGETERANRALAGATRALGLVLELDHRLGVLDGEAARCAAVAEVVRRVGPRLEAAERARRWREVASLLAEELVPALRAVPGISGPNLRSDPALD